MILHCFVVCFAGLCAGFSNTLQGLFKHLWGYSGALLLAVLCPYLWTFASLFWATLLSLLKALTLVLLRLNFSGLCWTVWYFCWLVLVVCFAGILGVWLGWKCAHTLSNFCLHCALIHCIHFHTSFIKKMDCFGTKVVLVLCI